MSRKCPNNVYRTCAGTIVCRCVDDRPGTEGKESMAEDISQKKKPLWQKWWFWTIAAVVLALGIIGSQEGSSQTPESVISSTTMPTSPSQSNVAPSSPSGADQDPVKVLSSVA